MVTRSLRARRPVPRLFDYQIVVEDGFDTHDGDTTRFWVWTGRYEKAWKDTRILGVQAPDDEIPGPEVSIGVLEATRFTASWLEDRDLRVTTRENDNFGRMLGDIYDAETGEHLDQALIAYLRDVHGINAIYRRDGSGVHLVYMGVAA